jgi:MFS family permease
MAQRRRQLSVGLAFVIAGIIVAVVTVHDRALRGIGSGIAGGGISVMFLAWIGPIEKRRGRRIAVVACGALAVLLAMFLVLKLVTTRHSTARLVGDAVAAGWIIVAVIVVSAMVRHSRGGAAP